MLLHMVNATMNKQEAIHVFGTAAALARALGINRANITQWPNELPLYQSDRVVGAAIRTGRADRLPLRIKDFLS